MKLYKVLFEHSEAMSAVEMEESGYKSVKVELDNKENVVRWITVFATDEADALEIANKVVKDYFNFNK